MAWWKIVLYTIGFVGLIAVVILAGLVVGAIVGAIYVPIVILSILKDSNVDVIEKDVI